MQSVCMTQYHARNTGFDRAANEIADRKPSSLFRPIILAYTHVSQGLQTQQRVRHTIEPAVAPFLITGLRIVLNGIRIVPVYQILFNQLLGKHMSCILRAGGKGVDVDALLSQISMAPDSIWRSGEQRYPKSATNQKTNEHSGVRFLASGAEFSEFRKQIEEATAFLRENQNDIRGLMAFPGVEGVVLDFGAEIHPPGCASFTFPPELSAIAGNLGLSLCLSVYPVDEEAEDA